MDVILRRVDDNFCDPLELLPDSYLGVPGLLQSVRRGNVAVAKLVKKVDAIYPAGAGNKFVQGTVQLHVVLDLEGRVVKVDVVSRPPELVDAAVNAVRQWRYRPTLLNGDPVEVDTLISIVFSLGG